jgi:UDP-3-O-[3-hydroxymyristoyl] glucosamine N-acyltransferase
MRLASTVGIDDEVGIAEEVGVVEEVGIAEEAGIAEEVGIADEVGITNRARREEEEPMKRASGQLFAVKFRGCTLGRGHFSG